MRSLKNLERENRRLKAGSELTLDKLILKEAPEGKYWSSLPQTWTSFVAHGAAAHPVG